MGYGEYTLKLGIVGLPNVGKSTLFNAITGTANAQAANYPFCTIEPNTGIVAVPDERLDKLAEHWQTDKKTPAVVEFTDIAGLVKGASKGEGLGNKFLANIRETDAIIHVLRCFDDDNVTHVDGSVNPVRDKEVIDTELQLKDLETVESRITKVQKQAAAGDILHPVIGLAENAVMVLYGRGQISGEYLRGVVIQGDGGAGVGIAGLAEDVAAYDSQRVGEYGDHMTVLLYVFLYGIAHKAPPLNISHAGDKRKEITVHNVHFLLLFVIYCDI